MGAGIAGATRGSERSYEQSLQSPESTINCLKAQGPQDWLSQKWAGLEEHGLKQGQPTCESHLWLFHVKHVAGHLGGWGSKRLGNP